MRDGGPIFVAHILLYALHNGMCNQRGAGLRDFFLARVFNLLLELEKNAKFPGFGGVFGYR